MDGFEYKKSLGQNFIKDDNIINKIVNNSFVDKDTLVIEIGPGSGALSRRIVPISGYTILYEIDNRLENILNDNLSSNSNYEIIFGDFLKQDLGEIRNKFSNYKKIYVVANLPYYITTPIIIKLLKDIYPDKVIIMVQEEVANRLSARCGSRDYGMISALINSKYNIKKLFKVSRNCFIPVPNVDSAVIEMVKCDKLGGVEYDKLEKLLENAFQFKRKNLRNNLKEYDLDVISKVLNKYGYSLLNRAEEIPIDVFIQVCKSI